MSADEPFDATDDPTLPDGAELLPVERVPDARFDAVERRPGAAKPDPILVADGVMRRFGGLTAVDVEHVEVQRNSITALIGPNGAGKTTFFNLLTGFDQPNSGTWSFDGRSLNGVPAYKVAKRGMVRTFQLTKALSRLSLLENMRLGAVDQAGEHVLRGILQFPWRKQEEAITARADSLLARFKLDHHRSEFAGALSGGQRKLLEMARALMVEPKMVMLDEPMAGVNPALKQSLLQHIRLLKDEGRTVLFVEHDMDMVRDISDWVIVMAEGRVIAEGTPDEIGADQRVIDAYLGQHHDVDFSELEEIVHEVVADERAQVEEATGAPLTAGLLDGERGPFSAGGTDE
jgi:neutral amino acid transport system ATP-binding protein